MSENNKTSLNNSFSKSIENSISNFGADDNQEYLKEIESSAESFKNLQEKVRNKNLSSQASEEDEDENEEEDEYEEEDTELEEKSNSAFNFIKNLLKGVSLKTLISTGASFGGVGAIAVLFVAMYRIHYTGEFEFKGISGEYQNFSFKKMNFTSFNDSGDIELSGLTKENKLTKSFYTFYSDNSYYAVVEDSKKYSDINEAYKRENLLTPEELRANYPQIEDVEGREKMFQLNPDVLYSLDKYLHKDKFLYPQQFIKPVYYEENKDNFSLKSLTNEKGYLIAKSQLFGKDGKPELNNDNSLKKDTGVWDYGLASILHYKEFEVPQREIVNSLGRTIVYIGFDNNGTSSSKNEEVSQTQINKVPSGTTPSSDNIGGIFDKGLRETPAYAIDKAVTAGGTVKSEITQRWQEKVGSRSTFTKESIITEQEAYTVQVPKYIYDEKGNKVQDGTEEETRYKTYTYKIIDTYEKYMEEYLPFYEGDPDTSEIVGSKYYRDYISNYSNYIPINVPKSLDFTVLDKEEISELIYDDEPGNFSNSVTGPISGETHPAEFTAYYASNDPLQGGFIDAMGNKLDYTKNTCAGPIKRDYPNSKLSFNSKIVIQGTGTEKDNTTCTITDTGGAIELKSDGTYRIDILMKDRTTAYAFGRRKGTITIMDNGSAVATVSAQSQNLRTVLTAKSRSTTLLFNQGGNAVTNYGMTMDDYANKRVPSKCDSGNCSVSKYRENVEPDAFKDKIGDLRHLRLDVYRPIDEQGFAQKFAEKFDSKMAPYAQSLIEACKAKNIDVLAKTAQFAVESGWGKRAIIGQVGGKTYYNFSGIGANDGNAYSGGLAYAVKKGWDTPEKGMVGAVEFLADDYIHDEKYKQNTLFKISMPWRSPNEHWYASNPDYAYMLANIMKDWTYLYSPGATFYYDLPTFDPSQPVGTTEGVGHGMQSGGAGSSAVGAFNSYLASNWSKFEEYKEILFPWSIELDASLEKEKKSNYLQLKNETLSIREQNKFISNLTDTDVDIVLNMMFALNQGNYLSKYDYMGEAEWKAMYSQLLSSPTGKTWDDKWIGFTSEEVFGKSLDDLGKLFDDGTGINPTVSKPFGQLKNIYSDDLKYLPQYNEMNFGMDLTVPPDTNVLALEDGTILSVEKNATPLSRYGNYVEIEFNSNTRLIIANLKEVSKGIKKGEIVKKGQVIGTTGGESKSYKEGDLYISLLYKGKYINPEWIITRSMTGFEDPIQGNNNGVICLPNSSSSAGSVKVEYVDIALQQQGKPYSYGASGPDSFDCSGLVYWSMKQAGIDIPRTSTEQRAVTQKITFEELQVGDLIFTHRTSVSDPAIKHVMIYIGNGQMVHAPQTGDVVKIAPVRNGEKESFGRYAGVNSSAGSTSSTGCILPGQQSGTDDGTYIWPVPEARSINSKFGWRWGKMHKGIDIGTTGQQVIASRAGEVIKTNNTCPTNGYYGNSCGGGFGNYVYVKHSDGFVTIYPHLAKDSQVVKVGDQVSQGQDIGKIGNSGSSTGAHLHFEIRNESGTSVDPLNYVSP